MGHSWPTELSGRCLLEAEAALMSIQDGRREECVDSPLVTRPFNDYIKNLQR